MRRPFLLGFVWLLGSTLHATVIVPAEFREVVQGSDIIAYGRVESVRAEWSDDRRRIETLVTFDVSSSLKGDPGRTIVFKVPGGTLGRYRSVMMGAPVFEPGDEAFVFLKTGVAPTPVVYGFNQGVFRVRPEAATGRRLVASPALLAGSDAPQALVRGAPERRPVPIESFAAQVRTIMAEAREAGR